MQDKPLGFISNYVLVFFVRLKSPRRVWSAVGGTGCHGSNRSGSASTVQAMIPQGKLVPDFIAKEKHRSVHQPQDILRPNSCSNFNPHYPIEVVSRIHKGTDQRRPSTLFRSLFWRSCGMQWEAKTHKRCKFSPDKNITTEIAAVAPHCRCCSTARSASVSSWNTLPRLLGFKMSLWGSSILVFVLHRLQSRCLPL